MGIAGDIDSYIAILKHNNFCLKQQRDELLKVCKAMQKHYFLTWSSAHLSKNIEVGLKQINENAKQAIKNAEV